MRCVRGLCLGEVLDDGFIGACLVSTGVCLRLEGKALSGTSRSLAFSQDGWSGSQKARRCVVVYAGDAPEAEPSAARISFGGQNPDVEATTAKLRLAAAEALAVDDTGAGISDEDLARRCVSERALLDKA